MKLMNYYENRRTLGWVGSFDGSAPPVFVTEFSNILESLNIKLAAVVLGESVFVSCVFVLLIMERNYGDTVILLYCIP